MSVSKHEVTVAYTTDDDGIHLWCDCGFDLLMGFQPTAVAVWFEAMKHQGIRHG